MPIASLFTHSVRYYRETSVRDALGSVSLSWDPQNAAPAAPNARPDESWSGDVQDHGAGEQQTGKRRWFLDRSLTAIEEGDVLDVTDGPDAPIRLRVEAVTRPSSRRRLVHHVEVNVVEYEGSLA